MSMTGRGEICGLYRESWVCFELRAALDGYNSSYSPTIAPVCALILVTCGIIAIALGLSVFLWSLGDVCVLAGTSFTNIQIPVNDILFRVCSDQILPCRARVD
jgi:hypothetical protein